MLDSPGASRLDAGWLGRRLTEEDIALLSFAPAGNLRLAAKKATSVSVDRVADARMLRPLPGERTCANGVLHLRMGASITVQFLFAIITRSVMATLRSRQLLMSRS